MGPCTDVRARGNYVRQPAFAYCADHARPTFTLVVVAVLGSYAYLNHEVSSIQRPHVTHLVADSVSTLNGQTYVFTAYPMGPTPGDRDDQWPAGGSAERRRLRRRNR
jgi:hypothetical protein